MLLSLSSYSNSLNCYNLYFEVQKCDNLEYALQVKSCLNRILSTKTSCLNKIKKENQQRIREAHLRLEKTKARLKIDSENLVTNLYNDFVDKNVKSLVDYNALAGEFNTDIRHYFNKVKNRVFKKSDKLLSSLTSTLTNESISDEEIIQRLNQTSVKLDVLLNNFRFFKQQFLLKIKNNNFKDKNLLKIYEQLAYSFDPAELKLEVIQKYISSLAINLHSEFLINSEEKQSFGDLLRKKNTLNQTNSKPVIIIPSLECNQSIVGCDDK